MDNDNLFPVLPVDRYAAERKRRKRRVVGSNAVGRPEQYQAFADSIKRTLDELRAEKTDLILAPSAGVEAISAAVLLKEQNQPSTFPMIKLRILSDAILAEIDKALLQRLRRLCVSGEIGLLTETAELRAHIERHYGIPVSGGFMLPCTLIPDRERPEADSRHPGDEFKIGVLGRQRAEKGSYRVPAILNQLRVVAAESGQRLRFRFVYQAVRSKRARRLVLELRSWLGARKNPDVTIEYLSSGMPADAFKQLVGDVDILLLPYSTKRYDLSGSGIILDGVLAQKPIVYSRGMANQELLSLGNAEAAASDREFAEKILAVAADYQAYQKGAQRAADHYSSLIFEQIGDVLGVTDAQAARNG
ncbi:glycosyltransferase family 4 protein [Nitratireductor sp. XY-223]|uniref:glycosyltransferase family 4 protein n=1 Tax=Nitratireductor sp. XY-223 TaxID=2561926 RepID=UPI0010AA61E7|nr:glycosyltransferase family 4 protein [Nitratireductor sp. XY-223]